MGQLRFGLWLLQLVRRGDSAEISGARAFAAIEDPSGGCNRGRTNASRHRPTARRQPKRCLTAALTAPMSARP